MRIKRVLKALLILPLVIIVSVNIPNVMRAYALDDSVTISGVEYVLTETNPYYIIVPESISVGITSNVDMVGRFIGNVSVTAPSSTLLYEAQNANNRLRCNITMGSANTLVLEGSGNVEHVSAPISAKFSNSPPLVGDWKGTMNYTVKENIAKDISQYLNFTLAANGEYYIISSVKNVQLFDYCNDNVFIPAEYNGKPVKIIGRYAFSAASGNTCNSVAYHKRSVTFTIPSSIEEIQGYAFNYFGNSNAKFVFAGSGLRKIGESAFARCYFTSFTIPDSVTEIGDDAFSFCNNLKSITLPPNLSKLGSYAFNYCSSLTGTLSIPDTITSVGSSAFVSTGIKSLIWDANATEMPYACFKNCTKLNSVEFGTTAKRKLVSIQGYALYGTGLTSITCPGGITVASNSFPSGCNVTYL